MSKYAFDKMDPESFESMCQALLESVYRPSGQLIQFGPGPDGGREATWEQPPDSPTYSKPKSASKRTPKNWVFQVKHHDCSHIGWDKARKALLLDLSREIEKITNHHKVKCHAYVLMTNIPLTGVRGIGTRDRITAIARKLARKVAEIQVWDAADISRILDNHEGVRNKYLLDILPGDAFRSLIAPALQKNKRVQATIRAYLDFVTTAEGAARAEEAGDEASLSLKDVFIDLDLSLKSPAPFESLLDLPAQKHLSTAPRVTPSDLGSVPASHALFLLGGEALLLLGGPGYGKSTLTQFLCLYHAARHIDTETASALFSRLKLGKFLTEDRFNSHIRSRIPFRVELRRYARWRTEQPRTAPKELADYIVSILINQHTNGTLGTEDLFQIIADNPALLVLDGLDEVPHPDMRTAIISSLQVLLRRAHAEHADIQLVVSSRPKGYSGEFDGFSPHIWQVNDLAPTDFDDYCDKWLGQRIPHVEDRSEARNRISRGMKSESVQRLAKSLLQATVMLAIVRRKIEIPHARFTLYQKYVEVIFDREKLKSAIVQSFHQELLRLHERVGYELHKRMERRDLEGLDKTTFREYVYSVLEEFSGDSWGHRKLKDVAQDIIQAATDRLCLLAGKGATQTDIDFAIQSFREFFAASYLFRNPEADPNIIFDHLSARGPYWANVLQFYAASASANQQARWVLSCQDPPNGLRDDASEFIPLVQRRRSLLSIAPDLSLTKRDDKQRTAAAIFSPSTQWTWPSGYEWEVFGRACGKETLTWLSAQLPARQPNDIYGVHFSLLLTSAAMATGAAEVSTTFAGIVEGASKIKELETLAFRSAVTHKVNLPCERLSARTLATIFREVVDTEKRTLALGQQSLEGLCKYVFMSFWTLRYTYPTAPQLRVLAELFPDLSMFDHGSVVLHSYLSSFMSKEVLQPLLSSLEKARSGPYSAYMYSLVNWASDPKCPNKASEVYSAYKGLTRLTDHWAPYKLVGPAEAKFATEDAHKSFYALLAKIKGRAYECLAPLRLTQTPEASILLFLHPSVWRELPSLGLVDQKALETFAQTELGQLLHIPDKAIQCVSGLSFVRLWSPEKLIAAFGAVLRYFKQSPALVSKNLTVWCNAIPSGTLERLAPAQRDEMFAVAARCAPLPTVMVDFLLRVVLSSKERDPSAFLSVWVKSDYPDLFDEIDYEVQRTLVESSLKVGSRLLDYSDLNAVRLGCQMLANRFLIDRDAGSQVPQGVIPTLIRIARAVEEKMHIRRDALVLLLTGPSHPEDVAVLIDDELFESIDQLREMIAGMRSQRIIQTLSKRDSQGRAELVQYLSKVVKERSKYPVAFAQTALNALIKDAEISAQDKNGLP